MRILRAADYRVMPWKNGGGTTTEVAVSPEGAGLDDFEWRVSMARVEAGGPFSSFAGVDRTLAVLQGQGIVLDIAGRALAELTTASAPFSFPADVATGAALISGSITDLNIMTRRGRMNHTVERLAVSAPTDLQATADTTLVMSLGDGITVVGGGAPVRLGPLDALILCQGAASPRLEAARATVLFVIRIDRPGGND